MTAVSPFATSTLVSASAVDMITPPWAVDSDWIPVRHGRAPVMLRHFFGQPAGQGDFGLVFGQMATHQIVDLLFVLHGYCLLSTSFRVDIRGVLQGGGCWPIRPETEFGLTRPLSAHSGIHHLGWLDPNFHRSFPLSATARRFTVCPWFAESVMFSQPLYYLRKKDVYFRMRGSSRHARCLEHWFTRPL